LRGPEVRDGDAHQAEAKLGKSLILFDGTTLAAWSQAGPGGFRLIDGIMQSYGGMGLHWYPERTFGDFVLDLDWRVTAVTDNSGVFLRFPDPGDDPSVAVNRGYEVQIYDDQGGDPQKAGALYGFRAPGATPLLVDTVAVRGPRLYGRSRCSQASMSEGAICAVRSR
jgi:hypothetical protein